MAYITKDLEYQSGRNLPGSTGMIPQPNRKRLWNSACEWVGIPEDQRKNPVYQWKYSIKHLEKKEKNT